MKTRTFRRILAIAAVAVPTILFAGFAGAMDEMEYGDSTADDCAMANDNDAMTKGCMSKDEDMSKNGDMMMDQSMEHEGSMMQEGGSMMQEEGY